MSNGMYCSASHWIDSFNSSAGMAGTLIFLMITEWPDSEVAKFGALAPVSSVSFWIASTTRDESRMEPSTMASGESGSIPTLTRWNSPTLRSLSSTNLMAELPMSRPTTLFGRDQNTMVDNPQKTSVYATL